MNQNDDWMQKRSQRYWKYVGQERKKQEQREQDFKKWQEDKGPKPDEKTIRGWIGKDLSEEEISEKAAERAKSEVNAERKLAMKEEKLKRDSEKENQKKARQNEAQGEKKEPKRGFFRREKRQSQNQDQDQDP